MESFWGWVLVPLAVLGGTAWLGGIVLEWLRRRAILDHPVERSSHQVPVPRGGGLAVVPLALLVWIMIAAQGMAIPGTVGIAGIAAVLAAVSWLDDRGGLSVGLRLLAHVAAAGAGLYFLPDAAVFQGLLPPIADRAATALLWVWFLNLYNFMDGIDAITCTETIALALGIVLIAQITDTPDDPTMLALVMAAGALGFLYWNRPPAKLFLGDVGSVPLGFVMGWLLLVLAAKGQWAPALILPLYYLADATLTLTRRLSRGERVWQAHRQHFYQRALGPDNDHGAVVRLIAGGNVALIILAGLAVFWPWPALVLAIIATAILLAQLGRRARAQPRPQPL